MLTIHKLLPQGQGLAKVLLQRAATVELDWDVRQEVALCRHRQPGPGTGHLPAARPGRARRRRAGGRRRVAVAIAAPQRVLKITACATHGTAFDLVRAAYHLGNRQCPSSCNPTT